MKNLGGLMVFFGAGSLILGLFGYEFSLLMWIDLWGPTVGWIIRIALIVVGGALWLQGARAGSGPAEQAES